mgnify:FL=1
MADFEIDDTVDITDVVCPTTFVKAKVALEELDDGQILAVRMNDGEPVQNVPRSIKEEGHQILKLTANEDGTYTYTYTLTNAAIETGKTYTVLFPFTVDGFNLGTSLITGIESTESVNKVIVCPNPRLIWGNCQPKVL